MYVRKFFKPEAKKELEEIVSYLRRSFKEVILKGLDWMPDAIKKRAELKLEAMGQYIAYDDEFTNSSMINDLHKGLEVSVDDFYGSIMQLRKFWRVDNFNKLRKKVDPKSWLEHYLVAMVNAYYDPETNFMGFPAGILQVNEIRFLFNLTNIIIIMLCNMPIMSIIPFKAHFWSSSVIQTWYPPSQMTDLSQANAFTCSNFTIFWIVISGAILHLWNPKILELRINWSSDWT